MTAGGRVESLINPFPSGSGRKRDWKLPDWRTIMAGGVNLNERDRPGGQTQGGTSSPGTSGALSYSSVNGVPVLAMTNGVNLGGGPLYVFDGGGRLWISGANTNVHYSQATDDYCCWRVYMVARVVATPVSNTDVGLSVVCSTNASSGVIIGNVPGWMIQYDTSGGCSLVQHGNSGAVTSTPIKTAAQGFVNTTFNMFEMRFLGATATTPGVFKVLLNNVPIIQRSFAGPDDLPLPSSAGGNVNNAYVTNIQAQSTSFELDVALAASQAAPFEAAFF